MKRKGAKRRKDAQVIELPFPEDLRRGKDEMNLAEFPLCTLQHYAPKGCNQLSFSDSFFDREEGVVIPRRLTITAPHQYGLPTPADQEVVVALLQLSKNCNFEDRDVWFTHYELVKAMRWDMCGKSYKRVDEALDKWAHLTVKYENAWRDNATKTWGSETFHILERVSLCRRRRGRPKAGSEEALSCVTWNEVMFRSFRAGHLKNLDYELYTSLETPAGQQMFRFLDKHFWRRKTVRLPVRVFAHEKVGVSRKRQRRGQIIEALEPGLRELEDKGFLEPQSKADRFPDGVGEQEIVLRAAGTRQRNPLTDEQRALREKLVRREVRAKRATELVKEVEPQVIQERIEQYDFLREKHKDNPKKQPSPGFLVASIGEGYSEPKGYESREKREKKKKEAAEARRKEVEEQRKREREREEQERRNRKIDAYVDELTEDEFVILVEAAAAGAGTSIIANALRSGLENSDRRGGQLWYMGIGSYLERKKVAPVKKATAVNS